MSSAELRPLYAVLGVAADASPDLIKATYRRLALAHHPDRQQNRGAGAEAAAEAESTFARIAFAYEVLGDPQRRKRYDLTGEVPQSDSALGRAAGETFLAEYVRAAPKAARGVSNKDMSLHSLENYEVLEIDGRDVPAYMRGIVMQGLSYLVRVVPDMEQKEVVLLRHYVMDQMYALLAYTAPLDEDAFGKHGYIITYYDHPLQAGIVPSWSDQNDGRPRADADAALKIIDPETFKQRQLVALEWHGPAQSAAPATAPMVVQGTGIGSERLELAVRQLVKVETDVTSWTVHQLRARLEQLLQVDAGSLNEIRPTQLMGYVYAALEDEEEGELGGPPPVAEVASTSKSGDAVSVQSLVAGSARVKATGRVGQIILHDPEDQDLTFKLQFSDGQQPETEWFANTAVETWSSPAAGA